MAEVEVVGIRVLEDNDNPVMVLRVVGPATCRCGLTRCRLRH